MAAGCLPRRRVRAAGQLLAELEDDAGCGAQVMDGAEANGAVRIEAAARGQFTNSQPDGRFCDVIGSLDAHADASAAHGNSKVGAHTEAESQHRLEVQLVDREKKLFAEISDDDDVAVAVEGW